MSQVQLTDAMQTSLLTLYGKAVDAKCTPSLLHDDMARQAIEKIDYDFGKLKVSDSVAANAARRAKHFDNWTREFLAAHPHSTVLHLGAGLDPRVWRIDPGPAVAWCDVDFPDVIDIREQLFPERENYRMIAASVTSPDWLSEVPADRPTMILAEGLTMYLPPAEGIELFRRLTDRFPSGVVAFDTHNRWAVRIVNRMLRRQLGTAPLKWAIDDPRELERAVPALRRIDVISSIAPLPGEQVSAVNRASSALLRLIPAMRDLDLYCRYEFG